MYESDNSKFHNSNPIFGTPRNETPFDVQQSFSDTCAIRSQEIILRDFGIVMPEEALVNQALENGWYAPGQGTYPQDVGNLLELHGIPVTRCDNANIFNLVNELAQGHRVIIGVDADELWGQTSMFHDLMEKFAPSGANHALIVSEIDTSDLNNITVTLTDPGTGEVAATYPLEKFQDAWEDSNCFMVATKDAPPASMNLPEMANFNYDIGHIESVFNMPYEQFVNMFYDFRLAEAVPGTESFHDLFDQFQSGADPICIEEFLSNWQDSDFSIGDTTSFNVGLSYNNDFSNDTDIGMDGGDFSSSDFTDFDNGFDF